MPVTFGAAPVAVVSDILLVVLHPVFCCGSVLSTYSVGF